MNNYTQGQQEFLHKNLPPVRGFVVDIQDAAWEDPGADWIWVIIYKDNFHAPSFTTEDRIKINDWLQNTLMPGLNLHGKAYLKIEERLT